MMPLYVFHSVSETPTQRWEGGEVVEERKREEGEQRNNQQRKSTKETRTRERRQSHPCCLMQWTLMTCSFYCFPHCARGNHQGHYHTTPRQNPSAFVHRIRQISKTFLPYIIALLIQPRQYHKTKRSRRKSLLGCSTWDEVLQDFFIHLSKSHLRFTLVLGKGGVGTGIGSDNPFPWFPCFPHFISKLSSSIHFLWSYNKATRAGKINLYLSVKRLPKEK